MEFFRNAKTVRLRSHHDKYLLADEDEDSVCQDRHGSSKHSRWTVEFVDGAGQDSVIRLKSCYDKYLTASNDLRFLGMTGKKVLQTRPKRVDTSHDWEPIREGNLVKFKTRYGNYLRANGGLPPWRNTISHDIPHTSSHQDWLLWHIDVLEARSPPPVPVSDPASSPRWNELESIDSLASSPPRDDGRTIYYHIADDKGNTDDETQGESFQFKGSGVEELAQKLREETGLEDIFVCNRSPLNGSLNPLRLDLPPNNATMRVVVVKASSRAINASFKPLDARTNSKPKGRDGRYCKCVTVGDWQICARDMGESHQLKMIDVVYKRSTVA